MSSKAVKTVAVVGAVAAAAWFAAPALAGSFGMAGAGTGGLLVPPSIGYSAVAGGGGSLFAGMTGF